MAWPCPEVCWHLCCWSLGRPRWTWSFVFLLDALVWLAMAAVLFWLAVHFFPEIREAVQSIPGLVHEAVDDIRNWWHGK